MERPLHFVCIGGGTGMPAVLKGLAHLSRPGLETTALDITAVVAMSDDGGSSGVLRRSRGVPPPGDVRNCLVALAEGPAALSRLFQHRFGNSPMLAGHTVGNLLIAALTEMRGDFLEAVHLSARLLGSRGRVLPSTLEPVHLVARMADDSVVVGEQNIVQSGHRVARVSLSPDSPLPTAGVLEAIQQADLIVLGPGSLYSSILPNLLVKGVARALADSRAPKVLIANLMTQPGETDDMNGTDHLQALLNHAGPVVDMVLLNNTPLDPTLLQRYREHGSRPVETDPQALARLGVRSVSADLLGSGEWIRHDPVKLARGLVQLARTRRPERRVNRPSNSGLRLGLPLPMTPREGNT